MPSYLLPVETVYKDDIKAALIDSGYWTAEEVAAGQAKLTASRRTGRARQHRLPGPAAPRRDRH